jgi:hypothetical protein
VRRFAAQKRQHGLVAPVHAIEIADGHSAGGGQMGVVEAAKNLHVACDAQPQFWPVASFHGFVNVRGYIVTEPDHCSLSPQACGPIETGLFVSVVF